MGNYLRASQVAEMFHVSPKTVARWAKEGKLPYTRTLGGHKRFDEDTVRELADRLRVDADPDQQVTAGP